MTGEHCVASVTEEVGELTGVTAVDVDLASGRLQVPGHDVTVEQGGARSPRQATTPPTRHDHRRAAGDEGLEFLESTRTARWSGVLPAGKVDVVRRLPGQGRVVAIVGNGVNDAPALAQADLGLAMGSGTDVAIEASDLTLIRTDLDAAVDAVRLSRRTLAVIKANLFWAFAYNVALIPLAAFGFLNPLLAGLAMAASSVLVVGNSLRLRRFRSSADPAA